MSELIVQVSKFFSVIVWFHIIIVCFSSLYIVLQTTIHRSHADAVFTGTKFILSVDISLRAVRVKSTLNITWSRGYDVIANNTRTTVSAVSSSGDSYTASLTYSPITISDSGQITANVSLYVGPYNSMCSWTFATDTELLVVYGISFKGN